MVGWHHQLDGHGFGWTSGVGDGQGDLVCCSPWGLKESDRTEQLNWCGGKEMLVKGAPTSSYLTYSSSVIPHIRVFPMSQFFVSGGQSTGDSASASVLPMNICSWLPVGLTGLISSESRSLLQHHNSKASVFHRSAFFRASLIAQLVKNPLAMQETPVRFLGWEDPLEKGKATHSSILAWRIPWTA